MHRLQESKTAEDSLHVVEGMQFDRGYISPYFVTDPERMVRRVAASVLLLMLASGPISFFNGRLALITMW